MVHSVKKEEMVPVHSVCLYITSLEGCKRPLTQEMRELGIHCEKLVTEGLFVLPEFCMVQRFYLLKMLSKGTWVAQLVNVCLQLRSPSWGPGIKPWVGLPAQRQVCFSHYSNRLLMI